MVENAPDTPAAIAASGGVATDPQKADIDRLRLVILRLARRIRTNSVDDITPSQLAVLATVIRHGPLAIGRIAELEHVKPPSISKIVAALERSGHLERQPDPGDRRCVYVAATAAGVASLDEVRTAGRTWLSSQRDLLGHEDRVAIDAALPALERLLGAAE